MDLDTAKTYEALINALTSNFRVAMKFTSLLEGAQQDEARYHIAEMARSFRNFATAIADYEGVD